MCLLVALVSRRSEAAPPKLDAAGVEGCPDETTLRSEIAAQLGRDVFDAEDAPRVAVRVRPEEGSPGALTAEVSLAPRPSSPATTRSLRGDSCADLVRAATLTVVLALEEERERARRSPPPPAPAAAPRPAPDLAREAEAVAAHPARTDSAVIVASAMETLGLLPSAGVGFGGSARLRLGAVWPSARVMVLPEARMANDAFALRMFAAGAGACIEPVGGVAWALATCSHVLAGATSSRALRDALQSDASQAYVAVSVAAAARTRVIGPWTLEGGLETQVPLARAYYVTTACPPTGFRQPFATLALSIGTGVSFH